ncbi:MAG: phage holin family protein [Chloroflexi bacterium]|nr:phage holin family protein [Chloroflexota bacterium]
MTPTPPTSAASSIPGEGSSGGNASIVDQTQDKMGQVVDQAQQTAGQVTEQAKQQATSQLESQKDRAVDSLVTVAQALRQTGQHLQEQEQGAFAGYLEQAAERVEGLTNHLRVRDVPQLLADTEDVARRSPGLFLGAAVALGFIGARFLMSSGQRARAQRSLGAAGGAYGSSAAYAQPGAYGSGPYVPRGSAAHAFDAAVVPDTGGLDVVAAGLNWWQSALLVGAIVAVVGAVLVQRGLDALKHADLAPRQTLNTLREDTQWAKDRMK